MRAALLLAAAGLFAAAPAHARAPLELGIQDDAVLLAALYGYPGRAAPDRLSVPRALDEAAALGVSLVKLKAQWSQLEAEPGAVDARALAATVDLARERGMRVMVLLTGPDVPGSRRGRDDGLAAALHPSHRPLRRDRRAAIAERGAAADRPRRVGVSRELGADPRAAAPPLRHRGAGDRVPPAARALARLVPARRTAAAAGACMGHGLLAYAGMRRSTFSALQAGCP